MLFRHLHFFQFQRFLFFFNFAKGTTVSRVRFTPFPSSRSSLEGARSRGARCSSKKKERKIVFESPNHVFECHCLPRRTVFRILRLRGSQRKIRVRTTARVGLPLVVKTAPREKFEPVGFSSWTRTGSASRTASGAGQILPMRSVSGMRGMRGI